MTQIKTPSQIIVTIAFNDGEIQTQHFEPGQNLTVDGVTYKVDTSVNAGALLDQPAVTYTTHTITWTEVEAQL